MLKKLISLLLVAVLLSISSFSFAFASGVAIPNSEEKVLGKPTDKVGTIVTFVDANLSKTSPLVTNILSIQWVQYMKDMIILIIIMIIALYMLIMLDQDATTSF
ncbi:hypothetical protein BFT35_02680 [Thermoanaerobacterium thermosaccharolyticum]|nr:hypothetical protein BFT35_02680 [Thermoanaerobacterium thermosaccharolyticum]